MSALDDYLFRPEDRVRRSAELDSATPVSDAVIAELLERWDRLKAWQVFDLMRGCILRIQKDAVAVAERDKFRAVAVAAAKWCGASGGSEAEADALEEMTEAIDAARLKIDPLWDRTPPAMPAGDDDKEST